MQTRNSEALYLAPMSSKGWYCWLQPTLTLSSAGSAQYLKLPLENASYFWHLPTSQSPLLPQLYSNSLADTSPPPLWGACCLAFHVFLWNLCRRSYNSCILYAGKTSIRWMMSTSLQEAARPLWGLYNLWVLKRAEHSEMSSGQPIF